MEKNHVLVTGGAGYIGSVLVPMLLEEGHKVTVIDNLSFRQLSLLHCFSNPNFTFIKGDASDRDLLAETLPNVEVIIPLAAIVGAPACKMFPTQSKLINYSAIHTLLSLVTPQQKNSFSEYK